EYQFASQRVEWWSGGYERVQPYCQFFDCAAAGSPRLLDVKQRAAKMSETYEAIEVRKPGEVAEVRRPLQDPGHDQVRIRVEACGVCHSDAATVEGSFPGITFPRVPGHEVVGRIDAVGSGVRGWQVGQRVGVGFLAGCCGYCEFCRG